MDGDGGGAACLPVLALAYFRRAVLRNDVSTARKVCARVLFESNYAARERTAGRKERESDATVELYKACIVMEVRMKDGGGDGNGGDGGRGMVGRLYDGVIGLLEGREDVRLAEVFRKRKLEDLA